MGQEQAGVGIHQMSDREQIVSVCMATYNGEKFITEQIESILCQLQDKDELIISDDGSTDSTISIIEGFNDKRIVLLHNNKHNYTENFENALRHAKGEFIFLSDQDDVWSKDKVQISLKYLKKYDFLYSNARIIDSEGNVIEESRNDLLHVKRGFIRNLIKTHYIGCCMAFTRPVLEAALPFPTNHDLCFHDSWISFLAEKCFKTYVCPEKLIDYRRHGANTSFGSIGITSSIPRMVKIRIYLFNQVCSRQETIRKHGRKNIA